MQDGDLSNEVAPRLLFVFEGTVATLPSKATATKERLYCRTKRWDRAVGLWEVSDRASALLWDVLWRYHYRFDIVTFRPFGFAQALMRRFDAEGFPVGNVRASSPSSLAQQLAYMPDVRYVYDADPDHVLTYGGRGVHMPGGLSAFTSLW